MNNFRRNEQLLTRMHLDDVFALTNGHGATFYAETFGEGRMDMRRRSRRMWVHGQLRPDHPILASHDPLGKTFGDAAKDLADLRNKFRARLRLREYDAVKERSYQTQ